MTEERIDGPTPNGGAYLIAYYYSGDFVLTDKEQATSVEIVEFDANDNEIFRTYMTSESPTKGRGNART